MLFKITSTALLLACLVSACEDNLSTLNNSELEFKRIAWNDLTQEEQESVVHAWWKAEIKNSPQFVGRPAVAVTFRTRNDALLGPIVVFIHREDKAILGRGARD